MKVQINSMDNGSGLNSNLEVWGGYNPQNKVFYNPICIIDEDDFIECFPEDKQDSIIKKMQKGVYIFDVNKDILTEKAKRVL